MERKENKRKQTNKMVVRKRISLKGVVSNNMVKRKIYWSKKKKGKEKLLK